MNDPKQKTRTMQAEVRTSATPEAAWNAWADPQKISQWFVDRAEGWAYKGSQVIWIFDEFGYRLPYDVVGAVPGEYLAFGGEIPGRPPFLLEIKITREKGETVIRLVNSGFLEGGAFDEEYEGTASGWILALALLKHYLEHHYGEPKKTILLMRKTSTRPEEALQWFTQPALLANWLTERAAAPLQQGNTADLELRNGLRVQGEVAAVSKREVALSWPAQRCFLELKAWGGGGSSTVAIRITGWNADPRFMEAARLEADEALDRLVTILET